MIYKCQNIFGIWHRINTDFVVKLVLDNEKAELVYSVFTIIDTRVDCRDEAYKFSASQPANKEFFTALGVMV